MFWQQLSAPTGKSAGMTVKGNGLVKCDSCPLPTFPPGARIQASQVQFETADMSAHITDYHAS